LATRPIRPILLRETMPARLLLISTSTVHGTGYLEHALPELRALLQDIGRVLFIPFALRDHDAYAAKARQAFASIGCGVDSLHEANDVRSALEGAPAVFCGGGNTFRLLKSLYEREALPLIRSRVADGMPYAGASAGANLACPTLKTTNDMPIVEPPSFEALGLVSFQINPHYLDPDPTSKHMGETRETRIREFHEENQTPVVGLREGAMLLVEERRVWLKGLAGARIFRRRQEPVEALPVASLDEWLR
jgi:dipeptidase E